MGSGSGSIVPRALASSGWIQDIGPPKPYFFYNHGHYHYPFVYLPKIHINIKFRVGQFAVTPDYHPPGIKIGFRF